jgi:hypothetical protein
MPEHWIRLRGGWEAVDLDDPLAQPIRMTLPVSWTGEEPRQLRLLRRFGRPPLDLLSESIWLRIDRVSGLYRLALNDRELSISPAVNGPVEFPLRTILDRNELVLEAFFKSEARGSEVCTRGWGEIALVIRPRADEHDRPLA